MFKRNLVSNHYILLTIYIYKEINQKIVIIHSSLNRKRTFYYFYMCLCYYIYNHYKQIKIHKKLREYQENGYHHENLVAFFYTVLIIISFVHCRTTTANTMGIGLFLYTHFISIYIIFLFNE